MKSDHLLYATHAGCREFARKLYQTERLIGQAARCGKAVISTSWGKDSIVLTDIGVRAGISEVMHMESPVSLGSNIKSIDYFMEKINYHKVSHGMDIQAYIEWVRCVGLPHERTPASHRKVVKEIKKDKAVAWAKFNNFEVMLIGLRSDEAKGRRNLLYFRGKLFQALDGIWRCYPLADWSAKDIWAYIYSRNLPYNRLYDCETHGLTRETIRNSGWLATDFAAKGRVAWLHNHFPREYQQLISAFPKMRGFQ